MKNARAIRFVSLTLLFLCLFAMVSWAGPHLKSMKLGKSIVGSFWGKAMLLTIIALAIPLLFYAFFRPKFKALSTIRTLQKLSKQEPNFEWLSLKNHCTDVFTKMHQGWSDGNAAFVSNLCTAGYWQDHQALDFERWKKEGVLKKSHVDKINYMGPILFRYTGSPKGEGSLISLDCKATVEEYIENTTTGDIEEGRRGTKTVETIWTFQLTNGKWLLNNIEPHEFRSVYLNLRNVGP